MFFPSFLPLLRLPPRRKRLSWSSCAPLPYVGLCNTYCVATNDGKIQIMASHSGALLRSDVHILQLLVSAADGSQLCPRLDIAFSYGDLSSWCGINLAEAAIHTPRPLAPMWSNWRAVWVLELPVGWAETSIATIMGLGFMLCPILPFSFPYIFLRQSSLNLLHTTLHLKCVLPGNSI